MSNFLLGQGPYTPWQMAAWGCVGLFGALVGRLSRRRLGRVGLALCCAFAALAAKEVMNVYTFSIGASHTPAAFLVVVVAGLPFDLTDTVASFLFGLAFGPELARLLARMRARMEIAWEPTPPAVTAPAPKAGAPGSVAGGMAGVPIVLALVAAATLALGGAPARASTISAASGLSAHAASLTPELSFLTSAQSSDGGFGAAKGESSSELYTAWAAIGLAAAGRDPASVRRDGHSVLDALRAEASTLSGLGDAERTILAAAACGASLVLVRRPRPRRRSAEGARQRQLLRAPRQPHVVRDLRAARRRPLPELPRDPRRGRLDRAAAELRRRLLLRRARLAQRRRRHRRGAPGARRRGRAQRARPRCRPPTT